MATSALRLQQLYNRKQNYALSLRELFRPLALRASCQLLTVFVLVGLVCELDYLKAAEYILDDSGQLIEMPLLAAEGLHTSTILVDISSLLHVHSFLQAFNDSDNHVYPNEGTIEVSWRRHQV